MHSSEKKQQKRMLLRKFPCPKLWISWLGHGSVSGSVWSSLLCSKKRSSHAMLTPCSMTLKTLSSTSFNHSCHQWGTSTTRLTLCCLDWPSLTFLLVPWTPWSMQSWSDRLMSFLWFSFRRAWAHALLLRFLQQEGWQKHVWMVGQ